MYNTLIFYQNYKKFSNYVNSVNQLYANYYEMLGEKINEDLDVYDKAKELDDYYEAVYDKAPDKFIDVKCLINQDYKEFKPQDKINDIVKCKRKGGRAFTKEFIANELAMENCTLISDYVNATTPIEYLYNGKKYSIPFKRWRNDHLRIHKKDFPDAPFSCSAA